MSHSPTPWVYWPEDNPSYGPDYIVSDATDAMLLSDASFYPTAPGKEDAQFIVRAVNAHEALVEALHNLVILARPHFSDEVQMLALSEAEAALKLARQP